MADHHHPGPGTPKVTPAPSRDSLRNREMAKNAECIEAARARRPLMEGHPHTQYVNTLAHGGGKGKGGNGNK